MLAARYHKYDILLWHSSVTFPLPWTQTHPLFALMLSVLIRKRFAKYGKIAGLLLASLFLIKGILWLLIPGLIIGSCAK